MKPYFATNVGKIIHDNFDARVSGMAIYYILEKGMDNIKKISDETIAKIKGNAMMTDEFAQSIVKTAKKICLNCTENDILTYVRCYLPLEPQIQDIEIYKEDMPEYSWKETCNAFDLDDDKEMIIIHGWAE